MKTIAFGEMQIHECDAQEWMQLTGTDNCCIGCVEAHTGKLVKTVWVAVGMDNVYDCNGELDCKDVCWASATGMQFTDGSYACWDCFIGHGGLCTFKEFEMLNTQMETFAKMFSKAYFIG